MNNSSRSVGDDHRLSEILDVGYPVLLTKHIMSVFPSNHLEGSKHGNAKDIICYSMNDCLCFLTFRLFDIMPSTPHHRNAHHYKAVSADLHIYVLNLYNIFYVAYLKLATTKIWIKTPRLRDCNDFLRRQRKIVRL